MEWEGGREREGNGKEGEGERREVLQMYIVSEDN